MTQGGCFVGIDVSKAWLDACLWPQGEARTFTNDRAGLRDLVRWAERLGPEAVAFEASGGYERALIAALGEAGLPARRVNPARVRHFARAAGVLAKNDRIDAAMIARFCATLPQNPIRHDPAAAALAELVTARRQLGDELTRCTNQAEHARHKVLKRLAARRAARLRADILALDEAIAQAVASDQSMARKKDLLCSVPGVGPVLAHSLMALMPELGRLSGRQAAALLGVAPFDRESGASKGQRHILGGRKPLRDVAYMAALVAGRHNPTLAAFKQRLKTAGKPPKVILVAIMRKLIVALNAILRDGKSWKHA